MQTAKTIDNKQTTFIIGVVHIIMSPIPLALVRVQTFCKVVSYGGVRNGKCYKMTLGLVVVGYLS